MLNFPNVKDVIPLEDYRLELHYQNGEVRLFDVSPYIKGEWYGQLKDPAFFRSVHPCDDTVEWAGGQDIAPHELYELSEPVGDISAGDIVDRLIARRIELGLSQAQLAELTGIGQSNIARLESKKAVPNLNTVLKVAKALNCQLTILP